MLGETTMVENRGETTRGETTRGKRLGGETSCYLQLYFVHFGPVNSKHMRLLYVRGLVQLSSESKH